MEGGGNGYEDKRALGSSEKLWNKLVSYGGTTSTYLWNDRAGRRYDSSMVAWFFPILFIFSFAAVGA